MKQRYYVCLPEDKIGRDYKEKNIMKWLKKLLLFVFVAVVFLTAYTCCLLVYGIFLGEGNLKEFFFFLHIWIQKCNKFTDERIYRVQHKFIEKYPRSSILLCPSSLIISQHLNTRMQTKYIFIHRSNEFFSVKLLRFL